MQKSIDWNRIQELVDEFRSNTEVVGRGVSENDSVQNAYFKILIADMLADLLDEEHSYALPSIIDSSMHEYVVESHVSEEEQSFKEILQRRIARYLSQDTKHYRILYFLNIRPAHVKAISSIKLVGKDIRILDWNEINERLNGVDELWDRARELEFNSFLHFPHSNFIPLLIPVSGITQKHSIDRAYNYFNALRACIQFTLDKGSMHYSCGPSKPVIKCKKSPIIGIFGEQGNYINYAYTRSYSDYRCNPFCTSKGIQQAILNANSILSSESGIRKVVESAISLYCESFDIDDSRISFLALWQAFEVFALKSQSRNLSNSQIASRIAELISASEVQRKVLMVLKDERNQLAHEGSYSHNIDLQLNVLKLFVESCIHRVLIASNSFNTLEELSEFYRNLSSDSVS